MTQKELTTVVPKANASRGSDSTTRKEKDNLAYLDDYMDTIEALPTELQRNFSLMRELDSRAYNSMEVVAQRAVNLINTLQDMTPSQRKEELQQLGLAMNDSLKNGEEKVSLATSTYDTVDRHIRRLDDDLQKFEDEQMTGPGRISATVAANASKEDTVRNKNSKSEKEKKESSRTERRNQQAPEAPAPKRRKPVKDNGTPPPSTARASQGERDREKSKPKARTQPKANSKPKSAKITTNGGSSNSTTQPNDMPIDPNEPVYCYCQQVSYGDMVACDNGECKIEWFHYACVELKGPPKGKWYCKECLEKLKKQRR